MTRTGPIPAALEREQLRDRRRVRLPTAWLLSPTETPVDALGLFQADSHSGFYREGAGPVIAMWPEDVSAVGQTIARALENRRRVYAIVASDEAERVCAAFSNAGSTSLLVRRVRSVPAGVVVTPEAGAVWLGTPGQRRWRLELTAEQADSAWLAALRLWWEDTEDEGWSDGQRFVWRAPVPAPFDVQRQRDDALVRFEVAPPALTARDGDWRWTNDHTIPPERLERVFLPPGGQAHDELRAVADRGTLIAWAELGLPEVVLSADSRCRSSSEHLHLDVRLDTTQDQALRAALPAAVSARFVTDLALRDLPRDAQVLLPDADALAFPVDREEIPCDDVSAARFEDLDEAMPSKWPNTSPLAREANYRWRVLAPRLPVAASLDPLVTQWEDADRRHAELLDRLTAVAIGLDDRVTQLPKSKTVGLARVLDDIRAQVEGLSSAAPSTLDQAEGRAALQAAKDAERAAEDAIATVEGVERAVAAERAFDERRAKHEQARQEAEVGLPLRREELEQSQQSLAEVERRLKDSADQAKGTRKELRRERAELQRRIESFETAIEHLEQKLRPFDELPPSAGGVALGAPKDPLPAPVASDPALPVERLPTAGRLMRDGQQRLLAVRTWEELDDARADAERLKADLVLDTKEQS